jgi:hypothetical protein
MHAPFIALLSIIYYLTRSIWTGVSAWHCLDNLPRSFYGAWTVILDWNSTGQFSAISNIASKYGNNTSTCLYCKTNELWDQYPPVLILFFSFLFKDCTIYAKWNLCPTWITYEPRLCAGGLDCHTKKEHEDIISFGMKHSMSYLPIRFC